MATRSLSSCRRNRRQAARRRAPIIGDIPYKVERRFVRTGETHEDRVAITSGVKAGELVVSEGQLKLQPGARVRIDRKAGLVPPPVLPKE